MPQATSLTVKNASNVDTLFDLITPAAGDGSQAVWYNKTGLTPAAFPKLLASARRSRTGVRTLTVRFELPATYVDPTSGLPIKVATPLIKLESVIPETYPESLRDNNVALALNLFQTSLLKAMARDAIPAT